jgi:hypothetical protein
MERVMTTTNNIELELTEAELDCIVGGSPKTKPSGSGQQEYLKVTMSDVLISSY